MRIISWNIDSLNAALTASSNRALLTRQVLDDIAKLQPDVIGIQETKLPASGPSKKHVELLTERFPGYELAWSCSQPPARKSYSGTMFLFKPELGEPKITKPIIGAPCTMDLEGRILTLEYPDYYLTQVYTPNAGEQLSRLRDRQGWDTAYADYLEGLSELKPVIAMGDFNVAHREIDLANPDANRQSAGFTDEERLGFSKLLKRGFTDCFRYLHGDVTGAYTWWAQRVRTSKINNSGWRIDYFLTSDRLADQVKACEMIDSGDRQDHTPILLAI
ncbi:MAG: exodeoxyribonuclease III [Eubacteriales bacterium]|nr:exodeoxyribonuclease III [Eubacteriales bacterium]